MRSIGGLVLACALLGVAVPTAQAATVRYDAPPAGAEDPADPTAPAPPPPPLTLVYGADDGANRLDVAVADGGAVFRDPVATLGAPVEGCSAALPLTCTLANVEALDIQLGAEDDTVAVDGAGLPATTVDGGAGDDRADYSTRSGAIISLDGTPGAGVAFNSVEDATGSPGTDKITGSQFANRLVGLGGDDDVDGGLGADTLLGRAGADTLAGGDGNDVLHGGEGADDLSGGAGDDEILAADDMSDRITCGDGADSVSVDAGLEPDAVDFDTCENVIALVVPDPEPSGPQTEPGARPQQQPVSSETALRAPVPVLADGVAAPGDRTAPSARLRVPIRQRLTYALRRGVAVPVSCSEACGISVAVVLDRRTARRLDLAGRAGPAVLGTATARMSKAGTRRLRVRLTQRARRALRPARSIRLTVQSLVSDAAGNGMLMQRRVTLRR